MERIMFFYIHKGHIGVISRDKLDKKIEVAARYGETVRYFPLWDQENFFNAAMDHSVKMAQKAMILIIENSPFFSQ
jgi:hypothetical protein